ncbi:MAG: TrbI/VirB10 family protein [Rickettsiaceae bacterium]|nr:TrbI/VirB10 family protein [Rickettsiaceae bacterium]
MKGQKESKEVQKTDIPKVNVELSKIASNPKQKNLLILIAVVIAGYATYSFMFVKKEQKIVEEKIPEPKKVYQPARQVDYSSTLQLPELPDAPKLSAPKTVEITQKDSDAHKEDSEPLVVIKEVEQKQDSTLPIPQAVDPNAITAAKLVPADLPELATSSSKKNDDISVLPSKTVSDAAKKRKQDKRKSSIILVSGVQKPTIEEIDKNLSFIKRPALENVLTKGKIIDAVTENAISSDFPAEVKAVIVNDVYSESGKTILIPKGSRVFGIATPVIDSAKARINIKWARIDLPTGYILNLIGTGIDGLGRGGNMARLDARIKEKLANSALSTGLNVAFASMLDELVKPKDTASGSTSSTEYTKLKDSVQAAYDDTNTTDSQKLVTMCDAAKNSISDASSTTYSSIQSYCTSIYSYNVSDAQRKDILYNELIGLTQTSEATNASGEKSKAQLATEQGMQDFSATVKEILVQSTPKPAVTLDQGSHVRIFVDKDYSFPKSAISGSRLLQ